MSSFQDFVVFCSKEEALWNYSHAALNYKKDKEPSSASAWLWTKTLNLEKTISSDRYVMLVIYGLYEMLFVFI